MKKQFKRNQLLRQVAQLEMQILRQTLAGEAFIYSIVYN